MKKSFLSLLALATLAVTLPAHATPYDLTISLVAPNQAGTVGSDIAFYGVITNNTNTTVNLDGDSFSFNVNGADATLNDDFGNTPFFLTPDGTSGASSGVIELFDISLTGPFPASLGTYDLIGDTDGVDQFTVGETTFSVASTAAPVTATPEPSSFLLLLSGIPAAILPLRKRIRRSN